MGKKYLDRPVDKEILSELAIYQGYVDMPKDWDIDPSEFIVGTLNEDIFGKKFPYCRTFERLNNYIKEYIYLKDRKKIVNEKTWGTIYQPQQASSPLLEANPNNFRDAPDGVLLYGTKITKRSCSVVIHYDNNKHKNLTKTVALEKNKFILFPSTLPYYITPNKSSDINFVQTITYKYF